MSQKEFGKSIGISQNTVSDLEKEKAQISKTLEILVGNIYAQNPALFLLNEVSSGNKIKAKEGDPMVSKLLVQAREILERGGEDSLALAQNIETFHRLIFSKKTTHKRKKDPRPFNPGPGGMV